MISKLIWLSSVEVETFVTMFQMDNSLRLIFQEASQILFKEIKANIDSDSNTFVTEVQVEVEFCANSELFLR